ncbi:MAG: hypothetical protein K6C05_01005 [Anaerovibrio sp.]|nr:hypothetical protein [Anaerovibrio sp.]
MSPSSVIWGKHPITVAGIYPALLKRCWEDVSSNEETFEQWLYDCDSCRDIFLQDFLI